MTKADDDIALAIKTRKSFVLDAGAGSGKTYSLVQALTLLRQDSYRDTLIKNRQMIACITYTNVAKNEIIERTENDPLITVATIHEFLWQLTRDFQTELRTAVRRFNAELKLTSTRKKDAEELDTVLKTGIKIDYSEFGSNLLEGRIHHDDLLCIANIMFEENPMLCKLVGAQYPYIFVDEYQDTSPLVVALLIDYIKARAPKVVIGFFGDKKQAIYDNVVGELSAKHKTGLAEILKPENYRCAKSVITVLNALRTDIQQIPAGENVQGAAVYVGVPAATDMSVAEAYDRAHTRLENPPEMSGVKALYLTHRLISREAGYEGLFAAYSKRGGYMKDKFQSGEDSVANFLAFQVDQLVEYWRTGNEAALLTLLQESGYRFLNFKQRETTKAAIETLSAMTEAGKPIADILAHVVKTKLLRPVDKLMDGLALAATPIAEIEDEKKKNHAFFTSLLAVDSRDISAYRQTLQNNTPYSTKHGVKGDEFDTVVVVIDDAGARWNKYAFGKQLEGSDTSEGRWERTGNLFYVCCSRAKTNLVVVDLAYSAAKKPGVDRIFGKHQVIV